MPGQIYKIGEAAQVLGLKSYVLRFWESEFSQLNPTRTESGQRLYSEQDLALLRRIRGLLHERGLTIEGARKVLNDLQNADEGLSSELLDEGYQDFFLSQVPDEAAPPAATRPEHAAALPSGRSDISGQYQAEARLEAENLAKCLADTLGELRELRRLLSTPRNPSAQV